MRERKSDQVYLGKMREVKTRDDVIDFAQYTQVAQVSCSGYSGELLRLLIQLRWIDWAEGD
jgi:hypothetical protein